MPDRICIHIGIRTLSMVHLHTIHESKEDRQGGLGCEIREKGEKWPVLKIRGNPRRYYVDEEMGCLSWPAARAVVPTKQSPELEGGWVT